MLTKEQYRKRLRSKGVDDGQYYHEQPISQPRRRSGADSQPQNPKPTSKPLRDNSFRSQSSVHIDTDPSHLGDSHAKPGVDTFRSDKDLIHCPLCGQATLTVINALEPLPEDLRCTACGARFRTSDLLNARLIEEMSNVLMMNNASRSVSIPEWKPKGFSKGDLEMTVKDYLGFDVAKSLPFVDEVVDSSAYRKLVNKYFKDLSPKQRRLLIGVLKRGLQSDKRVREIAKELEKIIGDPERSQVVARTEMVRLGTEANLLRMADKGTGTVEFVSAPEDGRLCEKCKSYDRKIFKLSEAKGFIPVHPRCRCLFTEYYEP